MDSSGTDEDSQLHDYKAVGGKSYVTLNQLSGILGVTYRTARRYVDAGKIQGVKVGGQYRIYEEEIRRFLESGNRL